MIKGQLLKVTTFSKTTLLKEEGSLAKYNSMIALVLYVQYDIILQFGYTAVKIGLSRCQVLRNTAGQSV